MCADLGVCWMVAEGGKGENPLPFSLTAKTRGRGCRGGIPASFQVPTSSSRFSPHPRLRSPEGLRKIQALVGRAPSPGGPGPKPPGDLAQAPGPGSRHSERLTSCKPKAATITPNPLTLEGVGWFPKAELYGVPVFAPAFQPLRPLRTWPTSP